MRKFLGVCVLVSVIMSCISAYGEPIVITAANFPDEAFRTYVSINVDKNSDGELSEREIAITRSIDVQRLRISSLKGIEYFTELTHLYCEYNKLTHLDVSKNTALMYLYCYNNALTELDISNNTALMGLDCNSNKLTELDVRSNLALEVLHCYSNDLTALDVSNNTALEILYCYDNALTALDVSNNIALTRLNCPFNQLTELNVSNNTALTFLSCSNNKITKLNISKNSALTTLYCDNNQLTTLDVSDNTALIWMYCYSNDLTALDVSGCSALTFLSCFSNQLTELDVSNNIALTSLGCFENKLTKLDISNNVALTSLSCHNNVLTALNISKNTALTVLACDNNQLTELNVRNNSALTRLFCYDNQLTALDVSKNTALTTLYCAGNRLTTLDVSNNTALTGLACHNNVLTALDVRNNSFLTSLLCHDNQLTTLDVTKNTALTTLFCYSNQLTNIDVSKNIALTFLACLNNQLIELDVSNNTALEILYCHSNDLTALDVSKNITLTDLACRNNQLTELDVSNNIDLTELDCGNNQLTVLNVSNNTALTDLYCFNNQLTALDVTKNIALTKLACFNNQLTVLDVRNNIALEELCCDDNQLTALDVSSNIALTDLCCLNNQLTTLNVTKNTALWRLSCSGNQLTELNVSNHSVLERLYCDNNQLTALDVRGCMSLSILSCYNNNITALDLTRNSRLEQLYCSDNNIKEINTNSCTSLLVLLCNNNQLEDFDVSRNTALKIIDCGKNPIKTLDVSHNTALYALWCWGNQLSELNLEHNPKLFLLQCGNNKLVSLNLSNNPKLEELYCSDNNISDINLRNNSALRLFGGSNNQISKLDLSNNTALTGLELSGNYLVQLDLSRNTFLDELYLSATTLRNIDLSKNTALVYLDICSSDITTLDLTHNTALQALNCYGNSFLESLRIISSDNSQFPYQVRIIDYIGNNSDRIESINAYKRDGTEIDTLFQKSDGILLCASSPYKLVYGYNTGYSGIASENDVSKVMYVTIGIPSRTFMYLPVVEPKIDRLEETQVTETNSELEISEETGEAQIVTKTITYSIIIGDHTIRRVNYNTDDEPASQDETPHYDSENWSTNLTLNSGLRNSIANAFNGISPSDIHLCNGIITSETWTSGNTEILSVIGEKLLFTLPEMRAGSDGVYVISCKFSENVKPGDKLSLYDVSGSYAVKVQAVFLDSNYNVIDYVPDNRKVYLALKLTSGRTNRYAVTSHEGTSSSTQADAEIYPFMTEDMNAEITSSDNHHEQEMTSYINAANCETICSLGTFEAGESGLYVFRVVMSDSLFMRLKDMNTSDFRVYALNMSGDTVIPSGNWDILDMSGEALKVFGNKEFLTSGFMAANIQTSIYLTRALSDTENPKVLSSGSSGGCNAGLGLVSVILAVLLIHRRKALLLLVMGLIMITASSLCAQDRINAGDYTLPVSFDFYTPSGSWTTNFTLTSEMSSIIAESMNVSTDKVRPYSEVALPGTWNVQIADIYNLARNGEYGGVVLPAAESLVTGNVYVILCTFSNDIQPGEQIAVSGFEVSTETRKTVYRQQRAYHSAHWVILDENYKRIEYVPDNRKVYLAVSFRPEYINTGILTVIRGEYVIENDPLERLDPDIAQRIADELSIDVTELRFLSRANIGLPVEPTPAMKAYVKSDDHEIIANLPTVSVDEEGIYVIPITLSDDVWNIVQGKDISSYKFYALNDSQLGEGQMRPAIVNGLISTWELFSLTGEKMDIFSVKTFLMVGFLQAAQPFSLYIAKLLLYLLLAGCNSGYGFTFIIAVSAVFAAFMLMKRKH